MLRDHYGLTPIIMRMCHPEVDSSNGTLHPVPPLNLVYVKGTSTWESITGD